MIERGDYRQIRDVLLASVSAVETETVPLEAAAGRILAQDIIAQEDVPSFARSPYDGYAFRAADTAAASVEHPVTLRVIDYIPAGEMPHAPITAGTAAHLMTGAPVPEGADAVFPFEKTHFTEESVTIFEPAVPGSNIIYAGEDIRKGSVLCRAGARIDAGLAGTLAGQGIFRPEVYRMPLIGIISTGTELLEEGDSPDPGKIYNTNRYSLQAACAEAGCLSVYLGTARDEEAAIRAMLQEAVMTCDAVLLSGGVSVGDFDCTPAAMEAAGVTMLARGAALKPGMAGAYGIFPCENNSDENSPDKNSPDKNSPDKNNPDKNNPDKSNPVENSPAVSFTKSPDADSENAAAIPFTKSPVADSEDAIALHTPPAAGIPILALSGNPAACMTAFYAIALPVLKKRMGLADILPTAVQVRLGKDFQRKNQSARLLRGRIDFSAVPQEMNVFEKQGNQMLGSLIGANAFALIPAGASVQAGESVEAFLLE